MVVLDDEEEVVDLTGAADGSLLAELLSAYDAANSQAVKEEKGSHAAPHHVDGTGSWVVLFSFGLTVDFYVGHKTVCVESGDALIFNGSPAHGVVHGLTNPVRRNATYRGKSQKLVGMRILDDKRMSVQARMS